jgi:hypothetical protein
MRCTSALLALAQLAMLAACAVSPPDNPVVEERPAANETAPTAAPAPRTYRPGVGIVESASVVSLSSGSSAAGATSPTMAYRLKMEDGTTQEIVQTGERFEVGARAQITGDGRLMRP